MTSIFEGQPHKRRPKLQPKQGAPFRFQVYIHFNFVEILDIKHHLFWPQTGWKVEAATRYGAFTSSEKYSSNLDHFPRYRAENVENIREKKTPPLWNIFW